MVGLIGKKIGMSRIFSDLGEMIPVTVIEAGPCFVVGKKSPEKHGYSSVQIGFGSIREKSVTKPMLGLFKAAKLEPLRVISEFRDWDGSDLQIGEQLDVSVFQVGDQVSVTGTSKGKGFTGVVKRYGFKGGPKTHGQSDRLRSPGSIGASSYPSRVWKGLRMAGHQGASTATILNMKIVKLDTQRNYIYIRGAVPGPKNGYLKIFK